jgi:glycine/D-amino acid oxidase-like deaminating enzyme
MKRKTFVIVGGGVAAISCALELTRLVGDLISVKIVSASPLLKEVSIR